MLTGEDDGSVEDEHLQEPLILGLNSDDEGSVGSEDSSDCDTEDDSMPPPIRMISLRGLIAVLYIRPST